MANVSLVESAAPKDFQLSVSLDSERYSRCMLCAAGRRAFHCADCIAAGNFVHSAAPYSERFLDKQLKLYRIRANRKYVEERCQDLLVNRTRHECLRLQVKQCKENIKNLKLAINDNKKDVENKRSKLEAISEYNRKLKSKMAIYADSALEMRQHSLTRVEEVQAQHREYCEASEKLAALRRVRIRQLTQNIISVRLTYDAKDSFDASDEFLRDVKVVEQPDKMRRVNLHLVCAALPANGDYSEYTKWVLENKDSTAGAGGPQPEPPEHPVYRISAGLALAAQLVTLVGGYLDVRLPYNLNFSDYCSGNMSAGALGRRVRRLSSCLVWVGVHARQPPPPAPQHALTLLHALCTAAATDDRNLGRMERLVSGEMAAAAEAWQAAWAAAGDELSDDDEPEPLEHINWDQAEELCPPPSPAPAPSLVTSLASLWRGWTK